MVLSSYWTPPSLDERDAENDLIVVSNRGPIEHCFDDAGRIRQRSAGGGVAVALASVARQRRIRWVAGACSVADRVVALTGRQTPLPAGGHLRLLNLAEETRSAFYEGFCNPLLWFVQHSLGGKLASQRLEEDALGCWRSGYLPANRAFADATLAELAQSGGRGSVMLHDYHLYVCGRFIRDARADAVLQQFVHIPWPAPEAWLRLPNDLVRSICDGLLANDCVVFQTDADAECFLDTCRAYLGPECEIDDRAREVRYRGVRTSVWCNPISVDIEELADLKQSQEVEAYRQALEQIPGRRTIVRVDRLDPSKSALRGFAAYEMLLERRPDLRRQVKFLAFLVPSRSGIPEYDAYATSVFRVVERINRRFGDADWQPVTVFYEQNRLQALAGLCLYDVLLVNSLADGLNLVSKEGPVLNDRDGVLVLSSSAGSSVELREGALRIDPKDIEGTAGALALALDMKAGAKARRAQALRTAIQRHQLSDWLRHQLKYLEVSAYMKTLV